MLLDSPWLIFKSKHLRKEISLLSELAKWEKKLEDKIEKAKKKAKERFKKAFAKEHSK